MKKIKCKYCDSKSSYLCVHCKEKLKLVRILQTMIRNKINELRSGKNG